MDSFPELYANLLEDCINSEQSYIFKVHGNSAACLIVEELNGNSYTLFRGRLVPSDVLSPENAERKRQRIKAEAEDTRKRILEAV